MAVVRSSSDVIAIRYVFPVCGQRRILILWDQWLESSMTFCLEEILQVAASVERQTTTIVFNRGPPECDTGGGAKSAIYDLFISDTADRAFLSAELSCLMQRARFVLLILLLCCIFVARIGLID